MQNRIRQICMLLLFGGLYFGATAQPQANFFFELPEGNGNFCAPLTIQFVNASTATNPVYSWEINGQHLSEAEDPQWIFYESGLFQVCLEVKDGLGKDRTCQVLQFFDPPNIPMDVATLNPGL